VSRSAQPAAALGFNVRTGWAAVVAVGGPPDAPEVLAKTRIDVATTFEEGAVYHMGQEMPLAEAAVFIRDSERRFVERARAGLVDFAARLAGKVAGAGMAAALPRSLPPMESILKVHPLVHAAEGELYRRVFAEACASLGPAPARVPPDALAKRVAAATGLTPAKVTARLAVMGKASGKPWAADQKQATLAAWLALATAR
jgi:hypothetical protein